MIGVLVTVIHVDMTITEGEASDTEMSILDVPRVDKWTTTKKM